MQDVFQPINTFVGEIQGMTRILSILISRKTAIVIGLTSCAVIALRVFLA